MKIAELRQVTKPDVKDLVEFFQEAMKRPEVWPYALEARKWLQRPISPETNERYRQAFEVLVSRMGYQDPLRQCRRLDHCCVLWNEHADYYYDDLGWVQCRICLPPSVNRGIVKPLDVSRL